MFPTDLVDHYLEVKDRHSRDEATQDDLDWLIDNMDSVITYSKLVRAEADAAEKLINEYQIYTLRLEIEIHDLKGQLNG